MKSRCVASLLVSIVAFFFLLIFSSCGEEYVPLNMPFVLNVYSDAAKEFSIQGLQCNLKQRSLPDDTIIATAYTDANGRVGIIQQLDDPYNQINHSEYYADYYLEILDIDGEENGGLFQAAEYQFVFSDSDEDNVLIMVE